MYERSTWELTLMLANVTGPLRQRIRSPLTLTVMVAVLATILLSLRAGPFIAVDTLVTGSMWALIAAGLALVFGVMNVPNFAQGEYFMVGTLSGYLVYQGLHPRVSSAVLVAIITLAVALCVGALLGAVTDLAIFAPMRKRSREQWVLNSFVVTIGISLILINGHQLFFGSDYKGILGYLSGPPAQVLGVGVARDRVMALAVGMTAILALGSMLRFSRIGRAMRGVAQDETGARLAGINVGRIHTLVFALSSGLAALAGATLLSVFPSYPYVGVQPLYVAWTVVILAGLGNVGGALIAGFVVALLQSSSSYFLGSAWVDVVPFALIVVILVVRPYGLFGQGVRGIWEQ
jgi:branched-chain amino acid transport system permease protein